MINLKIVFAMMLHHIYYWKHSLDRLSDSFYWPVINLLMWGLTSVYVKQASRDIPQIVLVVLSGVLFWTVIYRSQHEISMGLLEEFWNRNLINIFASPIRLREWVTTALILSSIKMFLTLFIAAILAYLLYSFSILNYGFLIIPFTASFLLTGWALGFLVAAILIRFGPNFQTLAWTGPLILAPFSAPYYPVSTLPEWGQFIAKLLPSSYIFEGMREILFTGNLSYDKLLISFALNIVYLILSVWFFVFMFNKSKKLGLGRLI